MPARIEIQIGASDKGGNASLKETVGLLEKLNAIKSGLTVDLFKAESVDGIKEIGERLTGVNVQISQYLNLASKATQAWQDDRTSTILSNLATKVSVARANAQAFGDTVRTQTSELNAYQAAFNQLIANGLDRTNTEVAGLEANINRLTSSIALQKSAIAEQNAYDSLALKLRDINSGMYGVTTASEKGSASIKAYQTAIVQLVKAGVEPTDDRIKQLQQSIVTLNAQMRKDGAREMANSFRKTGVLLEDARNKVRQLQHYLNFATSEKSITTLNKKLSEAQRELLRLNTIGLESADIMHKFGANSNALGTEFSRIIQDLPYASKAFGAIQNNFGAIGNNITRLTELLPAYRANILAMAASQGIAATTANVLKLSLTNLVTGWNGVILAISLLTTAYTIWDNISQKRARQAEKEKEKEKSLKEAIDARIDSMDALTQAQLDGQKQALKETTNIELLRRVIEDETVSRENRLKAIKELKRIQPATFKGLSDEDLMAGKLSATYDKLAESIMRVALAEAAKNKLVQVGGENLDIEFSMFDLTKKREKAAEAILAAEKERARLAKTSTVQTTTTGPGSAVVRGTNDKEDLRLLKEIKSSTEEISKAEAENNELLKKRRTNLEQVKFLQDFIFQTQRDGLAIENETTKATRTRTKAVKELKDVSGSISDIYSPDTDKGNLAGLEGLVKENQAILNRYTKMLVEVSKKEKEWVDYYKTQLKSKAISAEKYAALISNIEKEAAQERQEIDAGMKAELLVSDKKFATEKAQLLAEAEDRAGRSRIASREQELQAEKAYWAAKEVELKKYGITAAQVEEMRKSAEAQINSKWDQKMVEDSFIYRRRANESYTQMLLRRLNKETELELKAAKGNAEAKTRIQKEYFEQVRAIQQRQNELDFMSKFDGSAISLEIEKVKSQMENLRLATEAGNMSLASFGQQMLSLQTKSQVLELLKSQFQSLGDTIGTSLVDNLFEGKSLTESLEEGMKSMAKTVLKELVKIGLRYAINQAIGTSAMAATTAASVAAAKVTASAWASAAALSAAATFGASAVAGGAAIASLLASTKAMALAGFSSGGYTGNKARNEVAGFVHGQEFVVRASAVNPTTMPMLKALNAGQDYSKFVPNTSSARSFGSVVDRAPSTQQIIVSGDIRNETIHVSNKRAERFNSKFGRG